MDTFMESAHKMINYLASYYHLKKYSDLILTLDNLTSSSTLLGFRSFAHKASHYRKLLENSPAGLVGVFSVVSDLALELKLCETEWSQIRKII